MFRKYARTVLLAGGMSALTWSAASADTTLTLWSHWADEAAKVAHMEEAARIFESENPGFKLKITWYQQSALNAALKAGANAGQMPDIFYVSLDQNEFRDGGFLYPLEKIVDWSNVEAWAKQVWTFDGHVYGLALEVTTPELYYNKALLKDLGFALPAAGRFSQEEFTALVKKSVERGITPLAQGVGDRTYPGQYFTFQTLLKKLGKDEYEKLLTGKLKFSDPRVVEHLKWVRSLVEIGMFPKGFTTLKLGESIRYFHTAPKSVMAPMGSFYPGRAFQPVEKGGQPEDFPLGIMDFPLPVNAACPNCKTMSVAGSFGISSKSKYPELAGKYISILTRPEMGTKWLRNVMVQSGVKADVNDVGGKYAWYFKELMERSAGSDIFIGYPHQVAKEQCLDAMTQIMNVAFPAGLVTVDETVRKMDAACSAR